MVKTDPLRPTVNVLVRLGSLAVHVEEMIDEDFKNLKFDLPPVKTVLEDPEVKAWLAEMNSIALLPLKRKSRSK